METLLCTRRVRAISGSDVFVLCCFVTGSLQKKGVGWLDEEGLCDKILEPRVFNQRCAEQGLQTSHAPEEKGLGKPHHPLQVSISAHGRWCVANLFISLGIYTVSL